MVCVIDRIHIATHHILFNTHRNIIETCQYKGTTIDELLRKLCTIKAIWRVVIVNIALIIRYPRINSRSYSCTELSAPVRHATYRLIIAIIIALITAKESQSTIFPNGDRIMRYFYLIVLMDPLYRSFLPITNACFTTCSKWRFTNMVRMCIKT